MHSTKPGKSGPSSLFIYLSSNYLTLRSIQVCSIAPNQCNEESGKIFQNLLLAYKFSHYRQPVQTVQISLSLLFFFLIARQKGVQQCLNSSNNQLNSLTYFAFGRHCLVPSLKDESSWMRKENKVLRKHRCTSPQHVSLMVSQQ